MRLNYVYIAIMSAAIFTACTDKNDEPGKGDEPQSGIYHLSGKVEKGPFVRGSVISIQPLNESLNAIGTVFNGEIRDDAGAFDLGEMKLESQIVRITADGYYYNEVSGNLSTGTLHLTALADLSAKSSVNVNILTHLKSGRIQKLMHGGKTFAEADRQAQSELLKQFGLQAYETIPAESMSISSGTDGSGVLIAISSLMLAERSDAEITQYLSVLREDLADDGLFTDNNKQTISRNRYQLRNRISDISSNVISRYNDLGQSVSVPDLRYYYDWNNDGVAGNEIADDAKITLSQNEVTFDKNGGTATIEVTSNIPLTTEQYNDSFGEESPSFTESSSLNGFFASTLASMNCVSKYENSVLTITVNKAQRRSTQSKTVYLYDAMGKARAEVKVTQAGDPTITLVLGERGISLVNQSFENFVKALSWMWYVERGYTGIYQYYDVKCPMDPSDIYNLRAFEAAYASIAFNARIIKEATSANLQEASPYFILLNAITYTDMVDKWGRIGLTELSQNEFDAPHQESAETVLRYVKYSLDGIADEFKEKKLGAITNANETFNMSKDVWRIASANVRMALNEPSEAMPYLQEIIDSRRYALSAGNEYESNSGSILHVKVSDEVMSGHTMSYYSYADVLLLMAECHIATSNAQKASSLINQVAKAKGISVSGDNVKDINNIRKQLFMPRYFAFQKRNNLGAYTSYQKLWPIPTSQLNMAHSWTQNPGY